MSLLLAFLLLPGVLSYRILGFFPFPGTSHQISLAPILQQLAARGHKVVYLTPVVPKVSHPNLEVRLIKPFIKEFLGTLNLTKLGTASVPMVSYMISSAAMEIAHLFYGHPAAQDIIHGSETFDAVMMESYFAQEPVSALMHKFGCVGIEVSTLGDASWLNELSGLPDNPAYQVDFKTLFSSRMSFFERLHNFYALWSSILVNYYNLYGMQSVMDKYFNYSGWESRPHISKLVSNRSIILVNYDFLIGYPYPTAPHVKTLGGLNLVPNKPLPEEIQKFIDEAANGVIFFSLGSNLKTSELSSAGEFGKSFMRVFEELPQRVLWKWEAEELPDYISKSKNVMTSKWFPQPDILAHNNCVLFITHGGYMSLTETLYHGVPVVGIPFFGDQPKNMVQVYTAGFGVMLMPDNVTYNSAKWAVEEVLNNPRYKKEALRRSEMMRSRRHTGLEDAVYWIEYGIKYPNALTPESAFLTFFQLHQIDIFFFIFTCLYFIYNITVSKTEQKPRRKKGKYKQN